MIFDLYNDDLYIVKIKQIWEVEEIPAEWKENLIIPVRRKGDKQKCTNYGDISLINNAYTILSITLLPLLSPLVENIVGDYQCGYRINRSTIDQVFTIRQMLEKCWQFDRRLLNLFIDFLKAYDGINKVELWDAMAEMSILQKLIRQKCGTLEK